jgi:hypothetical protein
MINLENLFRLRLVVARYGEMDNARWWNSKGQLGRLGTAVFKRGFPRTHYFAQARAVFSVAEHRCVEVFDPPNAVTLWRLTEEIEQEFDLRWEQWLENASDWAGYFVKLESFQDNDLAAILSSMGVITHHALERYSGIRRTSDDRAIALPGVFSEDDNCTALLALGFARNEVGSLSVPYIQLGSK